MGYGNNLFKSNFQYRFAASQGTAFKRSAPQIRSNKKEFTRESNRCYGYVVDAKWINQLP